MKGLNFHVIQPKENYWDMKWTIYFVLYLGGIPRLTGSNTLNAASPGKRDRFRFHPLRNGFNRVYRFTESDITRGIKTWKEIGFVTWYSMKAIRFSVRESRKTGNWNRLSMTTTWWTLGSWYSPGGIWRSRIVTRNEDNDLQEVVFKNPFFRTGLQFYHKVECVFPVVIPSEFRMRQHRDGEHQEDAPHVIISLWNSQKFSHEMRQEKWSNLPKKSDSCSTTTKYGQNAWSYVSLNQGTKDQEWGPWRTLVRITFYSPL